jgi:hypothetical protein
VTRPYSLVALGIDAAAFCLGYALVSSLLVTGRSAISIVDPRIYSGGTFNARLVLVASLSAGFLAVVAWRVAYHLRRRH